MFGGVGLGLLLPLDPDDRGACLPQSPSLYAEQKHGKQGLASFKTHLSSGEEPQAREAAVDGS